MFPLQQGVAFDPSSFVPPLISAITATVLFVAVFAVVYLAGKAILSGIVRDSLKAKGFKESLVDFAVSVTVGLTAVVAVALAATVAGFGVVLAAFATLAGAMALAVGFAAKDLVANFVAGVFIIQDEPFVTGDWIEWAGNSGQVREVQLRVTQIDTFDNQLMTVPNNELANAVVVNNVANDKRRVSVGFGIGYDEDIEEARDLIVQEAAGLEATLDYPGPSAPVIELGDSAVVLSGRLWIDPTEHGYGSVRSTFLESVKERFDAAGIGMPYPHRELTGSIELSDPM